MLDPAADHGLAVSPPTSPEAREPAKSAADLLRPGSPAPKAALNLAISLEGAAFLSRVQHAPPRADGLYAGYMEAFELGAPPSLVLLLASRARRARQIEARQSATAQSRQWVSALEVPHAAVSFPNPRSPLEVQLELLNCTKAIQEAEWVSSFGATAIREAEQLVASRKAAMQQDDAAFAIQQAFRRSREIWAIGLP